MATQTFQCSHCGAESPLDDRYMVGNEAVCMDCMLNSTAICEHCGTRIWRTDAVEDDEMTLCASCFERHYTRCCECNDIVANDSAYYDDHENAYCSSCWDDMEPDKPIHEYSYKPDAIFYGEGNRYFGVELEIDGGCCDTDAAKHILGAANSCAEHLYIKTDGSLDCGLELVTHPMTLDYHLYNMPWNDVLEEARALNYLSHKTDTCGLHIHISRKAFGEFTLEQECSIARLLYFVEKFWMEMLRFSRRTEGQVNRWAARYGMKLSPQEVMDSAKGSRMGRYTAVNLTNYNTVEIRLFRGTLKRNTLLATLQMVNAICDVAVFLSDEELQRLSWHQFLDRICEPELIQYLKERNLYKNDPVTAEEDD